jgi:hypothetical protein
MRIDEISHVTCWVRSLPRQSTETALTSSEAERMHRITPMLDSDIILRSMYRRTFLHRPSMHLQIV